MQRKIAFYVDEHIGLAVVKALVRSNIDVITARDSGLLGAADARHLEHALLEKRVFVTGDADFARMHASAWQRTCAEMCSSKDECMRARNSDYPAMAKFDYMT